MRGQKGQIESRIDRKVRQRERKEKKRVICQRESISSSAGAVSRCRQSGYKQKVFSPLTSSTGPSVGRRHRNAYSPGVTATVCHQSVRLCALPADNASTRAQLRFITEWGEKRKKKLNKMAWWNIHILTASHLISERDTKGEIMLRNKLKWHHVKIVSHIVKSSFLLCQIWSAAVDVPTQTWVETGPHNALLQKHSCRH